MFRRYLGHSVFRLFIQLAKPVAFAEDIGSLPAEGRDCVPVPVHNGGLQLVHRSGQIPFDLRQGLAADRVGIPDILRKFFDLRSVCLGGHLVHLGL